MCFFCCISCIIWSLICLFPIFIVLKLQNKVSWSWGVVFIPLWILNIIPFIYLLNLIKSSTKLKALSTTFQYICLFIFEIILCLQFERMNNDEIPWNWAKLFIPIYFYEVVYIMKTIIKLDSFSKFKEKMMEEIISKDPIFGSSYGGYLIKKLFINLLRVIFIIFLILKLDNAVSWSWWINAIPLFVGMAWKFFIRLISDIITFRHSESEDKSKVSICLISIGMASILAIILSFIILVVLRLDGSPIEFARIFIPIFIVVGFGFLICCCCFLCFCCCAPEENFEESFTEKPDTFKPWWEIKKQKYIEYNSF